MRENSVTVEFVVDDSKGTPVIRRANKEIESIGTTLDKTRNQFSTFQSVFTGNVIAEYFTRAANAAANFAKESVQAAREAANSQRFILNSSASAKLSLDAQADAVERLRKQLGLSRTEAQNVFAGATQAATFVNRPEDAELFTKRLADLRAAKGVLTDLRTLQTQLFTSDETTDKIFGQNPSSIQEEYARSLGTTAGKLSDLQKNQALFNKVMTDGVAVTGAASAALQDNAGKLGLAASRFDDTKTAIGNAILENGLFNDSLTATIRLLENAAEARDRFVFRPTSEAATQASQGGAADFERLVTDPIQRGYYRFMGAAKSTALAFGDMATLTPRSESQAIATANAYREAQEQVNNDRSLNAEERQAATNRAIRDAEARSGLWEGGRRITEAELAEKRRAYFADLTKQANTPINDPAEAAKKAEAERKRLQDQIHNASKDARNFIDDIAGRATGQQNPFVKLFLNGETAAERMQERFGVLGKEIVNQFTLLEKKAIATEAFSARLQANMRATELEFQAGALQKGYVGITGDQQRQLGVLQKRFAALTNAPALEREAEAYQTGRRPYAFQQRQAEIADYEKVKRLRAGGTDEGSRAAQKVIDDYILQRTANLPITARFSPDAFTRELAEDRAKALKAQAQRYYAEIGDEIGRAKAGRYGVDLASSQLNQLAKLSTDPSGGANLDLVRKQFIDITKTLNPNELTGALRTGFISALRDEAKHERELEKKAQAFRDRLAGSGGLLEQIRDAASKGIDPAKAQQAAMQIQNPQVAQIAASAAQVSVNPYALAIQNNQPTNALASNNGGASNSDGVWRSNLGGTSIPPELQEKFSALVGWQMSGRFIGDPSVLLDKVQWTPDELVQGLVSSKTHFADPAVLLAELNRAGRRIKDDATTGGKGATQEQIVEVLNQILGSNQEMRKAFSNVLTAQGIKVTGDTAQVALINQSDAAVTPAQLGEAPAPKYTDRNFNF